MVQAITKVTKQEALKYLLPVLTTLNRLAVPYLIKEKEIIIKIPTYLPKNES